jgi:hypothetical protein
MAVLSVDRRAMVLWGKLQEFEDRRLFDLDQAALQSFTEPMRQDLRRWLPQARALLDRLQRALRSPAPGGKAQADRAGGPPIDAGGASHMAHP